MGGGAVTWTLSDNMCKSLMTDKHKQYNEAKMKEMLIRICTLN